MNDQAIDSPYRPGAPDPTLLTREESTRLETRLQREFDEKIRALKELHQNTFTLLGQQIDQTRIFSKEAVEAALTTQKEAAAKSETSTGKQLEALDRRISEVKERLDTGEGALRGKVDTQHEQREDTGKMLGISALVIGVVSILINIVVAIIALPHAPAVPVTVTSPVPPITGATH